MTISLFFFLFFYIRNNKFQVHLVVFRVLYFRCNFILFVAHICIAINFLVWRKNTKCTYEFSKCNVEPISLLVEKCAFSDEFEYQIVFDKVIKYNSVYILVYKSNIIPSKIYPNILYVVKQSDTIPSTICLNYPLFRLRVRYKFRQRYTQISLTSLTRTIEIPSKLCPNILYFVCRSGLKDQNVDSNYMCASSKYLFKQNHIKL